jgi:hypothetical protein
MKWHLTLLLAGGLWPGAQPATAQAKSDTAIILDDEPADEIAIGPVRHHPRYFSNALDAGILSAAVYEKQGMDRQLSYLRFSFIANIGLHFNYDFDEYFGMFTGLGIKNIGFTEKLNDSTIKRRVYTIGAPIGFKFGNILGRRYVLLGGGVDVPFHYKEKGMRRRAKSKSGGFFNDKTALAMPYLFAGFSMKPGLTFKLQFYPSNFFNVDYEEQSPGGKTVRPLRGYDARLLLVSLGLDVRYRKSEKPTNTPQ